MAVIGVSDGQDGELPRAFVVRRVGEEGDRLTGMAEYGHRAPYTETVEEQITREVQELVTKTILPGMAISIFAGNIFYSWQARQLPQLSGSA